MRIGIDLGGTKTEGILLDNTGGEVARLRRATPRADGYEAIVEAIAEICESLERHADVACRVGVGMPGTIDTLTGVVKNANTTCLIGHPLAQDLSQRLDRTVRAANDANCFAVAESRAGAAQTYDVVFGAILGTGVGGGVVISGEARSGRHGIAGEWGHSPIEDRDPHGPAAPACYCGQYGCLETRVSGPAFERDYQRLAECSETVPAAAIMERVPYDAHAQQAFSRYLGFLAEGLSRVFHVLDPDAVVLGGGMSNVDALYEQLPGALAKVLFNPRLEAPILRAQLGDSAGVFGAAWL